MAANQLLKTPLHQWHVEQNGRMVDFAGWSMPVQYSSIIDEHRQTRQAIGMFDVSHMGRLYFTGNNVDVFLDGLTTRRVANVECGKICLLYTSPSPRDRQKSRMPSSA